MSVALASTAQRRHHRRDFKDDEELWGRDLDAEELFVSMREHAGKHIYPNNPAVTNKVHVGPCSQLAFSSPSIAVTIGDVIQSNKEGRSSRSKSRQA